MHVCACASVSFSHEAMRGLQSATFQCVRVCDMTQLSVRSDQDFVEALAQDHGRDGKRHVLQKLCQSMTGLEFHTHYTAVAEVLLCFQYLRST